MEIESKHLRDIAHHLDEAKWDRYGHQSKIVAHGIQESGLLREMSSTRESLARLAAMSEFSLGVITQQLRLNNQMMSGLLEAVQNPRATEADELYRRGVQALEDGWVPEAISDLEESVERSNNPYNAWAHFALGCAYVDENKYSDAASAFSNAVSYIAWCELWRLATRQVVDGKSSTTAL
ncbi:MAG: hypothetical protein ACFB50_16895, partial [Rubrobacteraceae bacterium]